MSLIESERPVRVEVRSVDGRYSLFRDGVPFFVKGAGGFEHLESLASFGANSVRTWGSEQTNQALPDICRAGLSLCAGLWLVPPRQGFDYSDPVSTKAQLERLKQEILDLRHEKSLLLWGVGNELELDSCSDPCVWEAVEEVARFIKKVDPFHPVTTVLASPQAEALALIDSLCPSIDFVSVNAYGELEEVQPKLDRIGWNRPYLVTEWGADGHWEVKRTEWGAEIEPTSTEKAEQIRRRYLKLDGSHSHCLGSYIFLWGSKQETTATWFGLLSREGRITESVEAISALWKGGEELGCAPRISSIRVNGIRPEESLKVGPGAELTACFEILRGAVSESGVSWLVSRESEDKHVGGDAEAGCFSVLVDIAVKGVVEAQLKAPLGFGNYRLCLSVLGPGNTIATANYPFRVE